MNRFPLPQDVAIVSANEQPHAAREIVERDFENAPPTSQTALRRISAFTLARASALPAGSIFRLVAQPCKSLELIVNVTSFFFLT